MATPAEPFNRVHCHRNSQLSSFLLLADQAGYAIDLDALDPDAFPQAMIASFDGDEAPFKTAIQAIIDDEAPRGLGVDRHRWSHYGQCASVWRSKSDSARLDPSKESEPVKLVGHRTKDLKEAERETGKQAFKSWQARRELERRAARTSFRAPLLVVT
ncbi:hypothetical protein ACQR13_27770 [Bradyrhizobium sp. HKCCYLRH3059]|uniref:hypothetical protein n=1 Tax=Bradyrhizobium sp. HKCCYLRH3059 TaxID=3420745 RepID=UPI003EBA4A05